MRIGGEGQTRLPGAIARVVARGARIGLGAAGGAGAAMAGIFRVADEV